MPDLTRQTLCVGAAGVSEYGARINVSSNDGLDFLDNTDSETTMFFIDPPYFEKGSMLYLDTLDENYHRHPF